MFCLIILITATAAFDKSVLKRGLESASGQVKLFSSWMKRENNDFKGLERAFRFRVFRKNLKEIVEINDGQDMFELDANFMAGLTEQEQRKWYGMNITTFPVVQSSDALLSHLPAASQQLWREEGKVTPIKDQRSCGSGWSFAGIGSFEGHYAIKTGTLETFAEQEFLDCTYEGQQRNGCDGGSYWDAYDMVKRTQHLALSKHYLYNPRDGMCRTKFIHNGMKHATLKGTIRPKKSKNDESLIKALNVGPVAMAFEIKYGFNYYKIGILSIKDCGKYANHAMTVTGYTADFFEIKNSWGVNWGEEGYVRFDRKIENMCGISNWLAYPDLKRTGGGINGNCKDTFYNCAKWSRSGFCTNPNYSKFMVMRCKRTCGVCNTD